MYLQYLKETFDKDYLENDNGFIIYYPYGQDSVYIEEIYIKPDRRCEYKASELADTICEIAKKWGKRYLVGSVNLNIADPARSMKVLLGYGMRPWKNEGNLVFFIKDL